MSPADATPSFDSMQSAICNVLQVAFVKLKIPVTDRQLSRVAEALMRDIQASSKTVAQEDNGLAEEETLQQDKLAR
jgi:hypothetical protein